MHNDLTCEHCGGPGAEAGPFADEHIDLIECIEALRDQIRFLKARIAALEAERIENQVAA